MEVNGTGYEYAGGKTVTTAEQREKWRALEQAATPGPWFEQYAYDGGRTVAKMRSTDTLFCVNVASHVSCVHPAEKFKENGRFIAAASTAVPALLDHVEELEAENARLQSEVRRWQEEVAGTAPGDLWELSDPRMNYVTIQVDKVDYLEARKALEAK